MTGRRAIDPDTAAQLRVALLNALGGGEDDSRVPIVHPTIPIQVVHKSVAIVIDKNVGGVTIHVATDAGATIATRTVVPGGAEATHHCHTTNDDSSLF